MNQNEIVGILNFLKVGFLNTCFGYFLYASFLFFGLSYAKSLFIATVLGVIFNYFTFGSFVFSQKVSYRTFFKFVIVYSFVYWVNVSVLWLIAEATSMNPYIGQVICIIPIALLNWFLLNFWVYKKGVKF